MKVPLAPSLSLPAFRVASLIIRCTCCVCVCVQHYPRATGWVPLKIICSFPKMKKLSKDVRAIAAALNESEVLVIKGTRLRRKVRIHRT